ncbi:hypothetical protein ACWD5V_33890 [Streptomyces sp. NPDC002523]
MSAQQSMHVATVLLTLVAAAALWRTLATWLSGRWLTRGAAPGDLPDTPFVILLPALREQALVDETLEYFTSLDYPPDLVRIVVVTTERERTDRERLRAGLAAYAQRLRHSERNADPGDLLTGHLPEPSVARLLAMRDRLDVTQFAAAVEDEFAGTPTTRQLVERGYGSADGVLVLEAPADWKFKSGQLRYAFEHLDSLLAHWPHWDRCRYVAVYDFDGRPAPDALRHAAHAAQSGAVLLQQPGLTVPGRAAGHFSVFDGQLHARLGLRLELCSLLIDRLLRPLAKGLRAVLASGIHSVGNGLFIDRTRLPLLGGVPAPVDDLALGWRASSTGRVVEPIRSPTLYTAYRNAREAAASRAFICRGYLLALRDDIRLPDRVRAARPVHLVRIGARLVQWTFGPFLRTALLLWAGFQAPWTTLAVAALTYLLFLIDLATVHRVLRRTWRGVLPGPPSTLHLLLGPVALFWYGAGPRRALLRTLMRRDDRHSHGKTER